MLYLYLFGHLSVARCDGPQPWPAVDLEGRPGSLLAYLALARGRFFARSELLNALWSEQNDTGSLHSFNTALWRLRKALAGPPLEQTDVVVCDRRGAVGLRPDAQLQLVLAQLYRVGNPHRQKPKGPKAGAGVASQRPGVGLYRDDVLAGFTDDWALRARELHRRTLLNALGRLMQVSTLAQDWAGAIRFAQDILDRDTLREDVHRELMRLFVLNGQRAMALRQFELCRAALRKELAIEPMRETLAAYQRIADGAIRRAGEIPPAPSPAPAAAPWFPPSPLRQPVGANTALSLQELVSRAHWYVAQADARLKRGPAAGEEPAGASPPA